MYAQVEKPKENTITQIANSIAQMKDNSNQGFGVVDNRPANKSMRSIQHSMPKQNRGTSQFSGAAIQRYAKCPWSDWYYTENSQYAINGGDSGEELYVKGNSDLPRPERFFQKESCLWLGWAKYSAKATFTESQGMHHSDYYGPNDCGYYAWALSSNHPTWAEDQVDWSTFIDKSTHASPGADPDINLRNRAGEADPEVGESYFMWRTTDANKPVWGGPDACVHHAATVIATDGADKVTSESDASEALKKPVFHLHGSQGDQKFYEKYRRYYSAKDNTAPARLAELVKAPIPIRY